MRTKKIEMNPATIAVSYKKKLKNVTTPEELLALAQEMVAAKNGVANIAEQEIDSEPEFIEQPTPVPTQASQSTSIVVRPSKLMADEPNSRSPWYDIVTNDTEAMVIDLYAKGLSTRDIVNFLKRNHDIELSQPAISSITDKVFPLVKEWQSRPLSSCYPVLYLDGLHFKVRDAGKISSKVAYIALGINLYGQKEILGIWISDTEGAKFWMHVLNDLKNRGVDDVLIACVDGLKGFPEAVKALFPRTEVQVCIVHQIRHTLMFISHKDKKKFADFLKSVYTAPNEEAALEALHEVQKHWPQYASYLKGWESRWSDLSPFFAYPEAIKRMIYTTNTIENLNRQFRKVTKTTQVFPHDDALIKLLWLAQADITDTWYLTARNWGEIMAQFTILFPDRIEF